MEDPMTRLRPAVCALLLVLSLPATALGQAAPVSPAPPPIVVGRVLAIDECIAIALEAQPLIQATLYDYAAARAREAFAPLLPQLSGTSTATRSSSTVLSTSATTSRAVTVPINRQLSDTF